jgi:transcriptional regulator with XRE-family HTH domain
MHADGVSQSELSKRFGVTRKTISSVLKKDPEFTQRVAEKNNEEAEAKALSFMERMQKESEDLIGEILQSVRRDFANASVRDRMGAVKIMSECFLRRDAAQGAGTGVTVTVSLEDTSEAEEVAVDD